MNKWECEAPGCKSTAVGCGGAIGLRAIGWYFRLGPVILCPAHRPDGIRCLDNDENTAPCSICAADVEANILQERIATTPTDWG